MAKFTRRKFAEPDWLRSISPRRMVALLQCWKTYLAQRGCTLPDCQSEDLEYEALARALMSPGPETPTSLVDAFYYIHESSGLEDVEVLQTKVEASGLSILRDPTATPAEYVIDVWVADPELVRSHHAEALARQQKAFDVYTGLHGGPRKLPRVHEYARQAMEKEFDDWFADHRRGRGCRLLIFHQPNAVWIVVRHGRSMRRDTSHSDDGTTGITFYRPQIHDVLIYDERHGEIAVHAEIKGAGKLYLRVLGRHLFGDPDYFPQKPKFTLVPLIKTGKEALACEDIPGIEQVTLVEYRIVWGGKFKSTETHRANDIFGAMEQRKLQTISSREPVMAAFKIKFESAERERRIEVRMPASARYDRNDDAEIVNDWLRARGFMLA